MKSWLLTMLLAIGASFKTHIPLLERKNISFVFGNQHKLFQEF